MKNKKAFTLIELIAVVIVLALIAVLTIPVVTKSVRNSKEEAYNTQVEKIKAAAGDYMIENIRLFDKDGTYAISLGTLKSFGFLPLDLINPKTSKYIDDDSTIEIKISGNVYTFNADIIDTDVDSSSNYDTSDYIILKGSSTVYVELGSTYIDEGAMVIIGKNKQLLNGNTNSVNMNVIGTYQVTYTYNNNILTRNVVVEDTTNPTIVFKSLSDSDSISTINLSSSQVMNFNVYEGVYFQDNSYMVSGEEVLFDSTYLSNNNLGTLSVFGNLSSIPGDYYLTYTYVDTSGNSSSKTRKFIVS